MDPSALAGMAGFDMGGFDMGGGSIAPSSSATNTGGTNAIGGTVFGNYNPAATVAAQGASQVAINQSFVPWLVGGVVVLGAVFMLRKG